MLVKICGARTAFAICFARILVKSQASISDRSSVWHYLTPFYENYLVWTSLALATEFYFVLCGVGSAILAHQAPPFTRIVINTRSSGEWRGPCTKISSERLCITHW
jgi:hypothetical protein